MEDRTLAEKSLSRKSEPHENEHRMVLDLNIFLFNGLEDGLPHSCEAASLILLIALERDSSDSTPLLPTCRCAKYTELALE